MLYYAHEVINLKLYNTLTKQVEKFVPNEEGKVKMYTCGPTVYHYAHIGNLRTYIFEDILEKGLEFVGYDVTRVMNITDVGHLTSDSDTGEDKMAKGAAREGKTVYEIADFYTEAFFNDMVDLNIRKPSIIEKASDNIEKYIEMIEKMLADGYAYISNGNVYFDISKATDYYKLSGKNPEDLMIGVRDTVEEDKSKKNPADFVLWFTLSKFENQAMKWDSPWGVGYPGWHIECSGISMKYLGEYLDIHCGGVDNIFPHHTNEIAQSESYLGHPWCKYWFHVEHLNDQTGKMSKSKGEFLTVSLLEEKGYDPIAYRFFCLQSHYRKTLLFSYDALDSTEAAYKKLVNKVQSLVDGSELDQEQIEVYRNKFKDSLADDLNTANAVTVLYDVLKSDMNDASKLVLLREFDSVLSLDLFVSKKEEIDSELEAYVLSRIDERNEAKKNKDFAKADAIRDELLEKNIRIKDTREGTTFELVD